MSPFTLGVLCIVYYKCSLSKFINSSQYLFELRDNDMLGDHNVQKKIILDYFLLASKVSAYLLSHH